MVMTAKRYAARHKAVTDAENKAPRLRDLLPPLPEFRVVDGDGVESRLACVDEQGDLELYDDEIYASSVPDFVAWLCEMYPQARRRATAGGR